MVVDPDIRVPSESKIENKTFNLENQNEFI